MVNTSINVTENSIYQLHIINFFRVNLEEHFFSNIQKPSSNNTTTVPEISNKFLWWSITRQDCLIVFAALNFIMIACTFFRSFTFVSICMRASINLHNQMFNAITRATMYFFNTNSSGK